jgi:hypothetical protein
MKDAQLVWESLYSRLDYLRRICEGLPDFCVESFVTLFTVVGCKMGLVQFLHYLRPSTLGRVKVQIVAFHPFVLFQGFYEFSATLNLAALGRL